MSKSHYLSARDRMLTRIAQTRDAAKAGLPHGPARNDGKWTLTSDGDWTGGAFVGELWLAHVADPQRFPISDAHAALRRMLPRDQLRTAFKGFGFYHGAALGSILFADETGRNAALTAARSLEQMFDPKLGLIPLGQDAEEASAVSMAESSIDSLQATGLLYWAADQLGDAHMDAVQCSYAESIGNPCAVR
ncbi:hypothetical protein [Bradyrhizobium arachidis]|uniref:hypothetical protein n=1 Tax=Bradyrhizobium arachidis TaxID=858423 RepID=UPI0021639191|nr:hypothetical protein [Bradyrhizobium arachidis]UVO30228.1 hypothetical protein KUF59_05560 [Bradyrhizobium arachidis]